MANHLKMALVEAIVALHRQGRSKRQIARELGIDRETVRRHVRRGGLRAGSGPAGPGIIPGGVSDPAEVTPGSGAGCDPNPAKVTTGSDGAAVVGPAAGPPLPEAGRSLCEPFRPVILEKLEAGLSAQRIYQDLKVEHGFTGGYQSVKRLVRRLEARHPLPFRRMECEAGAEAQIDFGTGARIPGPGGRPRRTHVFRIILSHSRKGYSEAVLRQTTDSLIQCLENAFWSFGGVPRALVIDNLKAAVTHADWYDPDLNPKLLAFCRHYGTVLLPTKPATPRHKGKIESGVKYVRANALKGHAFDGLAAENNHLASWEDRIADLRIHGTTKRQVKQVFEKVEKPALLPLPLERFPNFHEAERIVHRDGHVEVDKAYYSAPPEYVGRTVWARWDSRVVRLFNARFEQIAIHAKQEMGRFRTDARHIVSEKISIVEKGATELLRRARRLGPQTGLWAENTLKTRGIEGMRTVVGLLALARQHTSIEMERACELASGYGAYRLRALRELLKREVEQKEFSFLEEHPLIRSLHDYGTVVRVSFREGNPWEERPEQKGDDGSNGLRIEGKSTNGRGPALLSTTTTNGQGVASLPTNQSVTTEREKERPENEEKTGAPRERAPNTKEEERNERCLEHDAEAAAPIRPRAVAGRASPGGRGEPPEPRGIPRTDPEG